MFVSTVFCFTYVTQSMVVGRSGRPGPAVPEVVVWALALECEPAQTLFHRMAGLTA